LSYSFFVSVHLAFTNIRQWQACARHCFHFFVYVHLQKKNNKFVMHTYKRRQQAYTHHLLCELLQIQIENNDEPMQAVYRRLLLCCSCPVDDDEPMQATCCHFLLCCWCCLDNDEPTQLVVIFCCVVHVM
jgi:hypothetical protein